MKNIFLHHSSFVGSVRCFLWAFFAVCTPLASGNSLTVDWSSAAVEWRSSPDNWDYVGPGPQFRDALWTGGRYVGVGGSGATGVSLDGRTWEYHSLGTSTLHAVASGGGGIVAVGDGGTIAHTIDGVEWEIIPTGTTQSFRGVAYGNDRWVAVGSWGGSPSGVKGLLFTSTNGIDWVERSTSGTPETTGAAFGNGVFLTVSFNASHTSVDGETWERHGVLGFGDASPHALAFLEDRFFAATETKVLTSVNGSEWEEVMETPVDRRIQSFGYAQGRFLAATFGTIFSSLDGRTWRGEVFPDTGVTGFLCIAASDEHLVLVGDSGRLLSDLKHPIRRFGSVVYGGDRFAAVGSSGRLIVSADGVNWSEPVAPALDYLWDLTHGAGKFVAVGSHGTIVTSEDGESWSSRESGSGQYLTGVAHGDGRFVAVGGDRTLLFSDDAEEWVRGNLISPEGAPPLPTGVWTLRAAAFGGGNFVAVGHDGGIVRSVDGETWTESSRNRVDLLNAVAYGNGGFVAVGISGLVLVSSTGETWLSHPLDTPIDLTRVRFLNGTFVATGWRGEILYSRDGRTWTLEQTPEPKRLADVATGAGKLVAVGWEGAIFHSPALPAIHQQPGDQKVAVGGEVIFSILGTSATSPTFQWYRDGEAISGATGSSLSLWGGARLADEGTYHVAIDDGLRTIWSMPARLVVDGDYLDWLAETDYTSEELEQPENSAPASDPGGYKIPNLLRYGFGLDSHAPEVDSLPRLEMRRRREYGQTGEDFVLNLPSLRAGEDLAFTVERSFNLTTWSRWPLDSFEIVTEGNRNLLILDPSVISPSSPAAFFRLQAEQPE